MGKKSTKKGAAARSSPLQPMRVQVLGARMKKSKEQTRCVTLGTDFDATCWILGCPMSYIVKVESEVVDRRIEAASRLQWLGHARLTFRCESSIGTHV